MLTLASDMRAELDVRFNGVEGRFVGIDTRLARLDSKIEMVARDLTIKGAGGLVVIAGIIIGLKLFA